MDDAIKRRLKWLMLQSVYFMLLVYKTVTYSGVAYYFFGAFTDIQ